MKETEEDFKEERKAKIKVTSRALGKFSVFKNYSSGIRG